MRDQRESAKGLRKAVIVLVAAALCLSAGAFVWGAQASTEAVEAKLVGEPELIPPLTLDKKRVVIKNLRHCTEDSSILVGRGNYDGPSQEWEYYVCRSEEDFERRTLNDIIRPGRDARRIWFIACAQYKERFTGRGQRCQQ